MNELNLFYRNTHLHLEHVVRISTQASKYVTRYTDVDLVTFRRTHGGQEAIHRGGGWGDYRR